MHGNHNIKAINSDKEYNKMFMTWKAYKPIHRKNL